MSLSKTSLSICLKSMVIIAGFKFLSDNPTSASFLYGQVLIGFSLVRRSYVPGSLSVQ